MATQNRSTYTVKDICEILNLGRTYAYEFIVDTDNPPPFIVHRLGKSIRIHKASFDAWFNGNNDNSDENSKGAL